MNNTTLSKLSFLELAEQVVAAAGKPMTAGEIWDAAQQSGLIAQLNSSGKTPEASLGAQLYSNVQKPNSRFVKVGARPSYFTLKTLAASTPHLQHQVPVQPAPAAKPKSYTERDLHPLLTWFADQEFGAHCRTVYHEKSLKKGEKHNQWVHPDVVGFALTTQDWTHEVVQLAQASGDLRR